MTSLDPDISIPDELTPMLDILDEVHPQPDDSTGVDDIRTSEDRDFGAVRHSRQAD